MIYLDYSSTTPCCKACVDAMLPFFSDSYGNPSSEHYYGKLANQAIALSRKSVAGLIKCKPKEIVFTSGATESNNIIFLSLLLQGIKNTKNRVVISAIEHKSVQLPARRLAEYGFDVVEIPVKSDGVVDLELANQYITPETVLVSCQWINNEVGTIQPVEELAVMAHKQGAWFHTDATQAIGKIPVDYANSPIDFMSFSAHKIGGPKGQGALVIANGARYYPWPSPFIGGAQEFGIRAGTQNVAGIIGFGACCKQSDDDINSKLSQCNTIKEQLLEELVKNNINFIEISNSHSVPHIINIALPQLPNDLVADYLATSVCISRGSSCDSANIGASHVVKSMGYSDELARTAIRISISSDTTEQNVQNFAALLAKASEGILGNINKK